MTRSARLLLPLLLLAAAPAAAQVHLGGHLDVAYRHGGADARPYLNATPTGGGTFYTPTARLFATADLAERWWVHATLQADYYGGVELNPVFFGLLTLNWQPLDRPAVVVQAGRVLTPFGIEPERYLGFDNPFAHRPLLYEWHMRVDREMGFFRATPAYDGIAGQAVVYDRLYAQGLVVSVGSEETGRGMVSLAATTSAPALPLQAGHHDRPAVVGRATFMPTIWSRIGVSGAYGPYVLPSDANDLLDDLDRYTQRVLSADLRLDYAYYTLTAQATWNRWTTFWLLLDPPAEGEPDLPTSTRGFRLLDDDVETEQRHLLVEGVVGLPFLVGAYAGIRYEQMRFGTLLLDVPAGVDRDGRVPQWMPDYDRVEGVFGYRLARNVLGKVSYATATNRGEGFSDLADDVFAVEVSVLF